LPAALWNEQNSTPGYFEPISTFNKAFIIKGLIKVGEGFAELPFEPKANLKFVGFLVKRIH
jgi:hypothetical protein